MRSNILLILTDQQAANSLGCYGNSFVQTPNLDRLAAGGTRFNCNLTNCPMCMPARMSLLTGRSPEVHGVLRNGLEFSEGRLPIFSQELRRRGYRTVWNGKEHWRCEEDGVPGPGIFLGFDEHHITNDNQIGEYYDWVCGHGKEFQEIVTGSLFNLPDRDHPFWKDREFISAEEISRQRARYIEPRMPSEDKSINYWVSPLPDELTQNAWIADHTIRALDAQKDSDRPFFIAASFVDPHDPYNPTEKFFQTIDVKACPRRRIRIGEHTTSPPHYLKYLRGEYKDSWINRVVRQSEEEWQMLRACYFAKVNAVDYHVGRILDALKSSDAGPHTTVIFTSDHGDMMGDHGMITKGDFHYDSCIRTPLIVYSPGHQQRPVYDEPTTLLDQFPTFLDLTGMGRPSDLLLEGESLIACMFDQSHSIRKFGMTESFGSVDGSPNHLHWAKTIRNEKWRYTWFPGGTQGQLFDLERDPDEFWNLWDDPSYRDIRTTLQEQLLESLTARCAPLPTSRFRV